MNNGGNRRYLAAGLLAALVILGGMLVWTTRVADGETSIEVVVRRCADSRGTVEATGDKLPPDFEYRCTSNQYPHWGVTSGPPNSPPHFVSINVGRIGSNDGKLRYVIAHEFCHARSSVGLEPGPWTDEQAADDCAKRYGFPNTYFARTDEGQRTPALFVVSIAGLVLASAALVVALVRRRRRR